MQAKDLVTLYNQALDRVDQCDISGAIDLLEECLLREPDAEAQSLLGLLYYMKSDFGRAHKAWTESVRIKPELSMASQYLDKLNSDEFGRLMQLYNESLHSYEQCRFDDALRSIDEVISMLPELIEPYELQIDCLIRLQRSTDALRQLGKLRALDATNTRVREFSKVILLHRQRRILWYRQLALAGCLALVLALGARQYISSMTLRVDLQEAMANTEALRIAQADLSRNKQALEGQLAALSEQLRPKVRFLVEDEQESFEQALKQYREGKHREALQLFLSIVSYGTREYLVRESTYFAACVYEHLGELDNAVDTYRNYISQFPGTNYYDDSLYRLGLILYRAGDKDGASEVLSELVERVPTSMFNNGRVRFILMRSQERGAQ